VTQATGSITVTDQASGVEHATILVGSNHHPMVVPADVAGHALGTTPLYVVQSGFIALAANKILLALFNAAGSGKIARVKFIGAQKNMAAVTGIAWQADLQHITTTGTGTAATPRAADSSNPAIPAQVTAAHSHSVAPTSDYVWLSRFLHAEETNLAAQVQEAHAGLIWPGAGIPLGKMQDLVLREGHGFALKQITSTTAGTYNIIAGFTLE
jgi:hypothetical protein